MSAAYPPPSFNDRAVSLMERLHYRRAVNDDDRDALFQLRYEGYLRDGGIGPNATGRFSDAWDDTDNVDLIGVYLDGQLAASVRIHVSGDDGDIPASDVFGDVVRPYIERGQRLVDATRFVIASDHARTSAHMPFVTLRAVAMAAEFYEAYGLLATVRSEHAPVYRRVTGHRQLSEPRAYPRLRKPIMCMLAETTSLATGPYAKHPFLRSTAKERAALFARPTAPVALVAQSVIAAREASLSQASLPHVP